MTYMTPKETAFANAKPAIENTTTTAIVVPCYNEAQRLDDAMFLETLKATPTLSFIFVNDGSKDKTLSRLLQMQLANPSQIDVINLAQNSGKAEAVRAGLQHACQTGVEKIGYWDADLATPLNAIDDFDRIMDRFNDITVVYGARRQMLGHRINRTLSRRVVSRICSTLARLAVGLPIGDTQCGAKLLRNTPQLQTAIAAPFTAGWLFDVELFTRIAAGTVNPKNRFYEMPLAEWEEIAGSSVSAKAIARSGLQMLRLIADRWIGQAKPQPEFASKTTASA